MATRFPQSVYRHGDDPDPRFSLANERTFLAWIRTSLAFLAAAGALVAVELPLHRGLQLVAAGLFLVAALTSTVWAWVSWASSERALRLGTSLPGAAVGGWLSGLLALTILALTLAVLIRGLG